ncbi:hypothetical protein TNCV_4800981 [Trichonephila clavipes]|nr:hypothetical protein TNCV_4800981 [Trichonephila clavipes]
MDPAQLATALESAWLNIPVNTFRNLIDSLPARLAAVRSSKDFLDGQVNRNCGWRINRKMKLEPQATPSLVAGNIGYCETENISCGHHKIWIMFLSVMSQNVPDKVILVKSSPREIMELASIPSM